ncbi:MAG: ribosomal RNA small subunit methyltransferase A [Pelagibacteraceae bacterium]|nr:ribosomal RNA small subunit methyltransferase A [Pelagibacteraceae bacterium]HJO13679.1 16S rRNA (adenine(1518)-N(6)/adenine(1519)-N(6))-dimethyltransferase RsmA [Alphaproteobacteria bacterium]MBO6468083.1 ribosomal RNA small subunit methyltransferase A [Pelagibacteraceae bacterium]MBO6470560.1 ribosomal RNA small subunit methyltransferase A [Pelagibacteraceae bacterium]MBO6470924.1 ribosomal RNA small subunit methyltransferase A [Pelagibacteraceae bacterium]
MHKPKKSLGQNFLIDKNIAKKIVNITSIYNQYIIEIGPGTGFLTDEIIKKKPKKLYLLEKDKSLYQNLKKKYYEYNNIEIINDDALKYDLQYIKERKKIISNLPYNISIKLIMNWLKIECKLQKMVLMIQKEVADKMNYVNKIKKNRLNLFIEVASRYNIEFDVSNNVFFPKPKINSSVITITPKNNLNIDLNKFESFTREIFQYKRKKLSTVLKLKEKKISLINSDIYEQRAEDLTLSELMSVFNQFYNY